jgi:hypothetical protein
MNSKGFGRKESWPNLRYYLSIYMEWMEKCRFHTVYGDELFVSFLRLSSRILNSTFIKTTIVFNPSTLTIKFQSHLTRSVIEEGQNDKQISIFWNITPCSPSSVNRRFGGTYCLHLQGRKISWAGNQRKSRICLPAAFTLVSCSAYFFDPEDGGDMFLRIWNSEEYHFLGYNAV